MVNINKTKCLNAKIMNKNYFKIWHKIKIKLSDYESV